MKNRKSLIIIYSSVILAITGCGASITQTSDSISTELSEKFDFQVTDFFSLKNPEILDEFVVDTSKVNTDEIGTYEIAIAYKSNRYTVSVEVQDTTAPTISLKEIIPSASVGNTITASDFVDVEDKSDYKVYFLVDNTETEQMEITSEIDALNIVAVDSTGNRSETLTLDIFAYSSLNPAGHYTKNEDGSVDFDDEYKAALHEIPGVTNLTQEQFDEALYIIGPAIATAKSEQAVMNAVETGIKLTTPAKKPSEQKPSTSTSDNTSNNTPSQPNQDTSSQDTSPQQPSQTPSETQNTGVIGGPGFSDSSGLISSDSEVTGIGTHH